MEAPRSLGISSKRKTRRLDFGLGLMRFPAHSLSAVFHPMRLDQSHARQGMSHQGLTEPTSTKSAARLESLSPLMSTCLESPRLTRSG